MTKIIKPRWIRKSEIRKQPVPVKPLPDWVDRFKYQPPEKLTNSHAPTWNEPEDVNCPSGLKAWPPGMHTFGGELIPCAWCGCLHNMFNFGREYYPQQFDDHPRHNAFERQPEDRRGPVTKEEAEESLRRFNSNIAPHLMGDFGEVTNGKVDIDFHKPQKDK